MDFHFETPPHLPLEFCNDLSIVCLETIITVQLVTDYEYSISSCLDSVEFCAHWLTVITNVQQWCKDDLVGLQSRRNFVDVNSNTWYELMS